MDDKIKIELLEYAPVIAAFHDPDHTILWANRAYQEATGHSLAEIKGKKCYSVWDLSQPCRNCPVTAAIIRTGRKAEAELTPKNQEDWPESQGSWLSSAVPIRKNGKIIGALEVAYDISERKKLKRNNKPCYGSCEQEQLTWPNASKNWNASRKSPASSPGPHRTTTRSWRRLST